jgi:predicted nuclease of predicted toxin-antitoxin system
LRFLLDEATPISLLAALRERGHTADHVAALGLAGSPDADVFALSLRRAAILISPDLDFSDSRAYPPGTHPGIIVLRVVHELSPALMVRQVMSRLDSLAESDIVGNIVVMEPSRTRIRRKEH